WRRSPGGAGGAGAAPRPAPPVDCAQSTDSTRGAAADAFARWTRPVAEALTAMAVPADRAEPLATLMISALEGALLIARTERDERALTTVARELGPLLDASVRRPSPGG
ncbi:LmrA/YxaF family transcription factor, partial [Streptomyces sp. NPDC004230]